MWANWRVNYHSHRLSVYLEAPGGGEHVGLKRWQRIRAVLASGVCRARKQVRRRMFSAYLAVLIQGPASVPRNSFERGEPGQLHLHVAIASESYANRNIWTVDSDD